jgi:hypothetical protein
MPITSVLDQTRKHVVTTVTGAISVNDILAHFQDARSRQTLPYTEFIDVRRVTSPWLSSADLWQAASVVRSFKNDDYLGPRAVLVGNELTFGLTRMFANLLGDYFPIQIFRDADQAQAWLAQASRPVDNG